MTKANGIELWTICPLLYLIQSILSVSGLNRKYSSTIGSTNLSFIDISYPDFLRISLYLSKVYAGKPTILSPLRVNNVKSNICEAISACEP